MFAVLGLIAPDEICFAIAAFHARMSLVRISPMKSSPRLVAIKRVRT